VLTVIAVALVVIAVRPLLPSVLTFLSNQFGHILLSYAALSFLGLGGTVSRADWLITR
jgi:ABC-type dipeptide/oligopeptide/nickel transport system permease subunit